MLDPTVLALVAMFVSVALVSGLAASRVLAWNAPGRRRIRELAGVRAPQLTVEHRQLSDDRLNRTLQRLSRLVPKSPNDMSRLRRRLARAGYDSSGAAVLYAVSEFALPVVAAVVAVGILGFNRIGILVALFVGVIGYLVPGLFLQQRIALRKKQIRNGLADVLDLLIVCLEAGTSLDQAMVKATEELAIAYPALAQELQTLITETRAGKPRLEAFKNLAQRTGVDEVRALVAMLVQTDRFGTSVSQALRTFAKTARTKRKQRAEEQAAKVGVKLVFPLVFLLFPAFYVVTLGPAIIQFVRIFFGQVMQQVP
jgi:tight adherence protein C